MWSIKGKICTIKDMNRINERRNRLDVLDVIRSFSMTYSLRNFSKQYSSQFVLKNSAMCLNS